MLAQQINIYKLGFELTRVINVNNFERIWFQFETLFGKSELLWVFFSSYVFAFLPFDIAFVLTDILW